MSNSNPYVSVTTTFPKESLFSSLMFSVFRERKLMKHLLNTPPHAFMRNVSRSNLVLTVYHHCTGFNMAIARPRLKERALYRALYLALNKYWLDKKLQIGSKNKYSC